MKFVDEPYVPILSEILEVINWIIEKVKKEKRVEPSKELLEFLKAKGFHFEKEEEGMVQ